MAALSALERQPNFYENLRELAQQTREVNIIATGNQATGKSALINGLIGEEVAPEGNSLDQETTEVMRYQVTIQGIQFNIWDSPGIEANAEDELRNMKKIAESVPKIDLLLYCIRMDDVRLRKQDILTINHFTHAFGEDVWNNAVFALTFANMVLPARNKDNPLHRKQHFEEKLQMWTKELDEALKNAGISEMTVETIPVAPAGYYCEPSLPDGRENWLSAFWFVCVKTMKDRAQPAMLTVNSIRFKEISDITPEDYALPIYRQPLVIKTVRNSVIPGAGGVIGGVIGLIVGGPAGIVVGGTFGVVTGYVFWNMCMGMVRVLNTYVGSLEEKL